MVKISVIVPVYNVGEFLEDSLSSLLNQTFDDFEAICVNDGSTDNSLEILNKFANDDSRIKVIDKENGGCGSARNRGLDESSGEYVYFFDPDDYITPNAFEELYGNITGNGADLTIFKIAWFKEGKQVHYDEPMFNFDDIFTDVDFNNFTFTYRDVKHHVLNSAFAPWAKLYRKEFLDGYDDFRFDSGVAFDDVPFHVKSMLRAEKISFAPDFYYHYRYENPNSVNNTSSNKIDIMKIIDIVEELLKSEGYFEELKNEFNEFKVRHIFSYMSSSNSEEYFKLAKEKLSQIDESDVPDDLIRRYNWAINSDSFKEYELNLKVEKYQNKVNKLSKKNKSLKKQIKKNKKLNDELISSTSWKVTKPLRKLNKYLGREPAKVSVIVPVYNVESYLRECLDSILNQSLEEIEVICINDGSSDGSLEILKEYKKKDSRIKVYSQENKGVANARNQGLDKAKGEYVFFIDADDFIKENTLSDLYIYSKDEGIDMALFKILNFDNETKENQPIRYFDVPFLKKFGESTFNYSDLEEKLYIVPATLPGKLIKRDIIENLRFPDGLIFEDTPFIVETMFLCEKMLFLDEYYYMRRVRNDSITRSNFSRFSDCIEIFNMVNDISRKYGYYDTYKELLFSRKYSNISTRFQEVRKEDKQEFFDKIKMDLVEKEDEVRALDFTKVKPEAKEIYCSAINSKNFEEFESSLNALKKKI